MAPELSVCIRPASPNDLPAIIHLVRTVVHETYPDLIARNGPPSPGIPDRWVGALIAEKELDLVGVGLATSNFISDLWIAENHRSQGIGAALLKRLENQIFADHTNATLRVVSTNAGARRFYARHSWRETRTYRHERDGHLMIDLEKERP